LTGSILKGLTAEVAHRGAVAVYLLVSCHAANV